MRSALVIAFALLALAASPAQADSGLITKRTEHSVAETLDRLEKAVKEAGVTVVARIDHAAAAARIGQTLRPTAVLLFGNPKLGTPLMQARQTIGIDLPLKVLAWEDDKGQVWLSYNAPQALASRHGLPAGSVEPMTQALERLTELATRP